LIQLADMTKL